MFVEDSVLDEVDLSSFCIVDSPKAYDKTQIFFPYRGDNRDNKSENNVERIPQKEFLNISTNRSSGGKQEHVIMNSLLDTGNGTGLRSGDLLLEFNDEPAHRYSHEQIIQHFSNALHQNGLVIEIKLKIRRREHGLPALITCIIRLEFGDVWHVRIENFCIEFNYKSKSKNTCRLETSSGKFLKLSDKSLDIQFIDYEEDIQYNFEYILYEVGPNESFKYDYMFCLRVLIDDEYYYLCPDETDGICLEKRSEIKDAGWKVRYDDRFFFQQKVDDITYIEKQLLSGIYLGCSESDELEFKVTMCDPWSSEAKKSGTSKEFQFRIYNLVKLM